MMGVLKKLPQTNVGSKMTTNVGIYMTASVALMTTNVAVDDGGEISLTTKI